ncbi:MAG: hypothetical protein LKG31_00810 [Lactobacillus sp.]|jgi:Na+/H+-dicarboxylate symporter|nr:hypothetical protein [Lactobacillus sp.]
MLSLLLLAAFIWLFLKLGFSVLTVIGWVIAIVLIWAFVAYLVLPILAIALIGGSTYWLVRRFI